VEPAALVPLGAALEAIVGALVAGALVVVGMLPEEDDPPPPQAASAIAAIATPAVAPRLSNWRRESIATAPACRSGPSCRDIAPSFASCDFACTIRYPPLCSLDSLAHVESRMATRDKHRRRRWDRGQGTIPTLGTLGLSEPLRWACEHASAPVRRVPQQRIATNGSALPEHRTVVVHAGVALCWPKRRSVIVTRQSIPQRYGCIPYHNPGPIAIRVKQLSTNRT
jgi:hypothetical protein